MSKQKGLSSLWKKIVKWLKDLIDSNNSSSSSSEDDSFDSSTDPINPPNPTPTDLFPQRASFLFDNAGTRGMNALSYNASDSWVSNVLSRQKANGDTTVWIFFSNEKDGSPVPTTMYKGLFGGELSDERVALFRKRLKAYRDAGFKIVAWMTADDSKTIANASLETHKQFVVDVHKKCGDLIDAYCVGLEMNEDARKTKAKALIAHTKAVTGKDTGVHLLSGSYKEALDWGADTLYYQTGFGKSAAQVKAECVSVISKLGGKCKFVLSEYHKSSDSNEAREIGKAAMTVNGCLGTGNGR
jgi:hypothetical protein